MFYVSLSAASIQFTHHIWWEYYFNKTFCATVLIFILIDDFENLNHMLCSIKMRHLGWRGRASCGPAANPPHSTLASEFAYKLFTTSMRSRLGKPSRWWTTYNLASASQLIDFLNLVQTKINISLQGSWKCEITERPLPPLPSDPFKFNFTFHLWRPTNNYKQI